MHTVFVANRRYDRAIGLAQRFGGSRGALRRPARRARREADIVVSCTASPHQIVGRDEMELVVEERAGRPLVMIDIAVPRDIEPAVRDLPGSRSTTWTTCSARWRATCAAARPRPSARARSSTRRSQRFDALARAASTSCPTIAALRERGDEIVEQVLRENESRWESLSEADRERLDADGARDRERGCCTSPRCG